MKNYDKINLYGVDFTHYRLLDLISLANQAEPFFKWVEKQFQRTMHRADSLDLLIKKASLEEIREALYLCMESEPTEDIPKLYDGGGIPYQHKKACFFYVFVDGTRRCYTTT